MIATKVGARPLAPGTSFTDNAEGLSARVIRESAERSRDRLGLARLDVLYAHIEDPAVPLGESLAAVDLELTTEQRTRLDAVG